MLHLIVCTVKLFQSVRKLTQCAFNERDKHPPVFEQIRLYLALHLASVGLNTLIYYLKSHFNIIQIYPLLHFVLVDRTYPLKIQWTL